MARLTLAQMKAGLADPDTSEHDADKLAWAYVSGMDWPLPASAQTQFWADLEAGAPEARLASSMTHALRWLRDTWPDSELNISAKPGGVKVEGLIASMGARHAATDRFDVPIDQVGRGVAAVALEVHTSADVFRQYVWSSKLEAAARDLKPWAEWDVERHGMYFHAVDHKNRLMGSGIAAAEKVRETPHRTNSLPVLMRMRMRYEDVYPEATPGRDTEATGPEPG